MKTAKEVRETYKRDYSKTEEWLEEVVENQILLAVKRDQIETTVKFPETFEFIQKDYAFNKLLKYGYAVQFLACNDGFIISWKG